MGKSLKRHGIEVRKSPIQGYGVFATRAIQAGEVIEECYCLMVFKSATEKYDLINYYFYGSDNQLLLPLGYGSIYNHSGTPNAQYETDTKAQLLTFYARQPIKKSEEIFVSYGREWFPSRNLHAVENTWRLKLKKWQPILQTLLRFCIVAGGLFTLAMMMKSF